MIQLRARYLMAMGLPLSCANEPVHQQDPVTPTATATASASATATAVPTATASATPTPTATATPIATPTATARGLSNVPHFSAQYPFVNHRGCTTAMAHCYLLSDLQKQAHAGATCPAQEDVPDACMGGTACLDPDARTTGSLLAQISRSQTAAKHAQACCYQVPDNCCAGCGRTLRDGDRIVVTPAATRSDWASRGRNVRIRTVARAALAPVDEKAKRFAGMAAAEHASIASFARTSLELMALGAPAELVRDTHLAALDEIEHARICYELAAEVSGAPIGPGNLAATPITSPTFASFAVATFLDACVGETLGASQIRDMIRDEDDASLVATLARIADDEERHAELAFRTLAWAVRAGGDETRDAVRTAMRDLDARTRAQTAVAEVVIPCTTALLAER